MTLLLDDLRKTVERVDNCRICNSSELRSVLYLGFTPIAYRLLDEEQLDEPEPYYPLEVVMCRNCELVQLKHKVEPRLVYPPNYPYDMETTQTAVEHFNELAEQSAGEVGLKKGDLVIDIGSSSGILLKAFRDLGAEVLGVEPATEMAERAREKGIKTISEFFGLELAEKIRDEYGGAKLITGTNLINQIDDLREFIDGIETLLKNKGLFVFETPHLLNTIQDLHYDHVYHEHSSFFSIPPIQELAKQQKMHITRLEKVEFRGGSIRAFLGRENEFDSAQNIEHILRIERDEGVHDLGRWEKFASEVKEHRRELNTLVYSIKDEGGTIAGISATAKGNSMMNYCGWSNEDLEFITEVMDTKIGKYTPGGHIPIVHDDVLMNEMPDYAIIWAWNFADTIMENLQEYSENGGKFIVPAPKPHVIE